MNKKEIIDWTRKYDEDYRRYDYEIEKNLHKKFRKNKFMTKSDLIKINEWKFSGLKGRKKINLRNISDDDSFIKLISQNAFKIKNDKHKIKLLSTLDGVGVALASVILTFYDPKNYGVIDIHVWRELFGKEPQDMFNVKKEFYLKLIKRLREIAKKYNLKVRDVEKALYKKNKKCQP